jgi:hypothetical protein
MRAFAVAGSPSVVDGPRDLSGESGVVQKLLDECAKDLLSGDAGESEAVSGVPLPNVEGSVCGG